MHQLNQKPGFSAQAVSHRRNRESRFLVSRLVRLRWMRGLLLVVGWWGLWLLALAIEIVT
jgi:hypothetical protein